MSNIGPPLLWCLLWPPPRDARMSPGAYEAVRAGCTCPVQGNSQGQGICGNGDANGWWVSPDCPMHAAEVQAARIR